MVALIVLAAIIGTPRLCIADVAATISDTTYETIGLETARLWLDGDDCQQATARRCADALGATIAVTGALKTVTNSSRPNNAAATDGFPSGKTALAVCTATVLAEREHEISDWGYLWAASVGWSRIELDEHNAMQVLAGAAIGHLLGREAAAGTGIFGDLFIDDSRPCAFAHDAMQERAIGATLRLKICDSRW